MHRTTFTICMTVLIGALSVQTASSDELKAGDGATQKNDAQSSAAIEAAIEKRAIQEKLPPIDAKSIVWTDPRLVKLLEKPELFKEIDQRSLFRNMQSYEQAKANSLFDLYHRVPLMLGIPLKEKSPHKIRVDLLKTAVRPTSRAVYFAAQTDTVYILGWSSLDVDSQDYFDPWKRPDLIFKDGPETQSEIVLCLMPFLPKTENVFNKIWSEQDLKAPKAVEFYNVKKDSSNFSTNLSNPSPWITWARKLLWTSAGLVLKNISQLKVENESLMVEGTVDDHPLEPGARSFQKISLTLKNKIIFLRLAHDSTLARLNNSSHPLQEEPVLTDIADKLMMQPDYWWLISEIRK